MAGQKVACEKDLSSSSMVHDDVHHVGLVVDHIVHVLVLHNGVVRVQPFEGIRTNLQSFVVQLLKTKFFCQAFPTTHKKLRSNHKCFS